MFTRIEDKEPISFMRLGSVFFGLVAIYGACMAVGSWFEFQRNPLPVVKFAGVISAIKAGLCTLIGLLLYLPWRPFVYLLGYRPFYVANAITMLLLVFSGGAPTLVHFTNRPYDLVSDGTLAILYYGYIPISAVLWIASTIAVVVVWTREKDTGRRPLFWIFALGVAPLVCTWVLYSRILY